MFHRILPSNIVRHKNPLHTCRVLLHYGHIVEEKAGGMDPKLKANDFYVPMATWPVEGIQLYNKLKEETSSGEWVKYCKPTEEGSGRRYLMRATAEKLFSGAFFICKTKAMIKGVMVFGPWLQGPPNYVHGGGVSTVHDTIAAILVSQTIGSCVTANLNTNFQRGILLGEATYVTAKVNDVSGRKVKLTSKIISTDERVLYSDATSLFILMRNSDVKEE